MVSFSTTAGYELEVAIRLSIPDNTAFTALRALRALGYPELDGVRRATIYRLQLDRTARSPEDVVAALLRAEVLFNPNKHEMSYRVLDPVAARMYARPSTERGAEYEAIVSDNEDDTSRLTSLLKNHFGLTELRSLTRAVAWLLFESGTRASAPRHRWACAQLLCNPYSQRAVVAQAPSRRAVGEPVAPAPN